MRPIEGYDNAPAYTGEFAQLPAGKYKCVVKQAEVHEVRGSQQMIIYFDIVDGEYKDFYSNQFKQMKASDPKAGIEKWKGRIYQNAEGQGLPFFKGIIKSIERSNPGYEWKWEEKTLTGKLFGGVFGREEFITNDGEKRMATKCVQVRSIDGLAEAKVPEDKLLPDNAGSRPTPSQASAAVPDSDGFVNIPEGAEDEGIPFL